MLRNQNCPTTIDKLSKPAGMLIHKMRRSKSMRGTNSRGASFKPNRPWVRTPSTATPPSV